MIDLKVYFCALRFMAKFLLKNETPPLQNPKNAKDAYGFSILKYCNVCIVEKFLFKCA